MKMHTSFSAYPLAMLCAGIVGRKGRIFVDVEQLPVNGTNRIGSTELYSPFKEGDGGMDTNDQVDTPSLCRLTSSLRGRVYSYPNPFAANLGRDNSFNARDIRDCMLPVPLRALRYSVGHQSLSDPYAKSGETFGTDGNVSATDAQGESQCRRLEFGSVLGRPWCPGMAALRAQLLPNLPARSLE